MTEKSTTDLCRNVPVYCISPKSYTHNVYWKYTHHYVTVYLWKQITKYVFLVIHSESVHSIEVWFPFKPDCSKGILHASCTLLSTKPDEDIAWYKHQNQRLCLLRMMRRDWWTAAVWGLNCPAFYKIHKQTICVAWHQLLTAYHQLNNKEMALSHSIQSVQLCTRKCDEYTV